MNILDYLAKRVNKKEIIEKPLYADGVFDILSFLFVDLWELMKEENRFFGIIPVYKQSIQRSFNKVNSSITNFDDIEVYGKILYLFKPIILKNYRKLCSKHLSKADAVIVLINKISEVLENTTWFEHKDELKDIRKIVEKLFNNIRNNAKNADLLPLISSINYYMEQGWAGKLALHDFHIKEEDELRKNKTPLEGSGVRFTESDNESIVSELVWKDE